MSALSQFSDEELERRIQQMTRRRLEILAAQRELKVELDRRLAADRVAQTLAELPEDARPQDIPADVAARISKWATFRTEPVAAPAPEPEPPRRRWWQRAG